MATTFIKPYKVSSGLSAIQTMQERFDYGLDPKKCVAVSSYMCEPETAYAEFMATKSEYEMTTGRNAEKGHLFFQIRQAFPVGEVSVEEAQRIGYETAMRWTKGKYQFFVCTHNDKEHLHNHIYYNATAEDGTRKFHNFLGSSFHVRRLSDRICIENHLSIISNPKQRSDSKYKHYGEWLDDGKQKTATFQERLKTVIDTVLQEQPKDFDAFLSTLESLGFEHKWGRGGVLSFRSPEHGQERFTRLRSSTLGDGYSIEDIRDIIEGYKSLPEKRTAPIATRKVNLVIDIQEKMAQGKGAGYQRWATVYNLKQMAAALQYLQENNLLVYEDLATKAESATARLHNASDKLQQTETAMKRNADFKSAIVDYARNRPIFEEYKKQKYSRKYLTEHESEIAEYRAAQSTMSSILSGGKLPKIDELKEEWQTLKEDKKSGYSEYRTAQKEMREVVAVKANIDHLLGIVGRDKNKEMER
ncbi:MAG: relaxase/mobilization nuclease domain-containing protein [Oscillospiraceae bacterium]|nr:relaxase/mobilization nuclease domain-containing protein [Oscillospiraceae bacterium]